MRNNLVIGIDARILSDIYLTGIGRYLLEILSRITKNNNSVIFILYSHKKIIHGDWNLKNVYIKTNNFKSRFFRMIWAQTYLPYKLNKDNIHIFWSPSHRIPYFISSRIFSVVTIHDLVWKMYGRSMRPFSRLLDSILMPFALRVSDVIISVSNSTKNDIVKYYPGYFNKIVVIHNGCTSFNSFDDTAVPNSSYILFVGTFEPRKNIERLIQAFRIVKFENRNDIKLLIVGSNGWGDIYPKVIAENYNISNDVIVLGFINDSQLNSLYYNCLFLVYPSLYEGFGLPIVEALNFSKPILTSNISSMPEVCGAAGYLVDPTSIYELAFGIDLLINNDDIRNEMSEKAVIEAKKFNWDNAAALTFDTLIKSYK